MPHTQCLGFLLGYTELVLYAIFYVWVGDFEQMHGDVNCLRLAP